MMTEKPPLFTSLDRTDYGPATCKRCGQPFRKTTPIHNTCNRAECKRARQRRAYARRNAK